MKNITGFILLLGMVAALLTLLFKQFPNALSNDQNKIAFISSLTILTLVISRVISSNIKYKILIQQISSWTLITILILGIYSYKIEIQEFTNRLTANLIPGYGQENQDGSITFYRGNNGHFSVTATINDHKRIDFLLDTGASSVSLTHQAAKSLGIDPDSLEYNYPLSTANGISWGARIKIDKMQVGPIIIYDIEGTVSKNGLLDTSLLGMSFLNHLKEYNIQGNKLTMID